MKRIRLTYHTLHFLKTADPKLRKAIIANCNKETLESICECALIVLSANIPLSPCNKRKLRTYKNYIRKVADKRVSLSPPSESLLVSGVVSFCRCCLLYYRISPGFYSARVNYVTQNVFGFVRSFSEIQVSYKQLPS